MRSTDPKRVRGERKYTQAPQQPKKARNNGGYRANHTPPGFNTRHAQVPYLTERPSAYFQAPERHPHSTATTYGYPVSSQSPYAPLDTQERYAHSAASQAYYVLDDATTSAGYGSAVPGYLSHTGSGGPGVASHSGGPVYLSHAGSGGPGYLSHTGSGGHSHHPLYM